MSGTVGDPEDVRSAVPVPDLCAIDDALNEGPNALKDAIKKVRPADLGRDLSRRPPEQARALLDAIDDRRGAAMLRATHPVVAARLLSAIDPKRAAHVLSFVPTDHEVAIVAQLPLEQRALAKVVALSFFVPLLIGTGGNAGSQTVSTIIRALALGEIRTNDVLRVLRREVTAGLLLGLLLGTIAFFRALLWGVDYDLAFCVAVTILAVCTWANAVGSVIPLAAQKLGIDPTVISAPLITTLVDASGLFIYFSAAKLMIAALSGS